MNLLKLSWKNLVYRPGSSVLTLLLFALGVGLIAFILQVNDQVQQKFERNLADIDLVIGSKGSPLQLILSSMYHIDAPTGNVSLEQAAPFLRDQHPIVKEAIPLSLGDNYRGYRVVGTTHDFLALYDAEIAQGERWKKDFEVVVGKGTADELDLSLGDRFHSSHGLDAEASIAHDDSPKFKVVGILEPSGSVVDQLILTNTSSIWGVHGHQEHSTSDSATHQQSHEHHDHHHHHEAGDTSKPWTKEFLMNHPEKEITSLLVKYKNRSFRTLSFARQINENTNMQAADPAVEINRLYVLIGDGTKALKYLGYVIAVVSGLSILISLLQSLRNRRYELALMRVMGSSRFKLFVLIVLEGIILAGAGCLIGLFISHIGLQVLTDAWESSFKYTFEAWRLMTEEFYIIGGSVLLGFVAAIIPGIQAAKTDISETLRGN